ncbi:hypothetical protein CROQUDRAFT_109541 [Cronartium quercuum f. sp. fusiforme G11]|uniref:Uncharacterized protein n=1 Tax=Cronartium quercuum f. sp. fusiforme G11 TaxID=708437 RepID=A0A9P6NES3_9BASI|nr:hypothetical protein CROQUDRAFT_109541 [Cronartium quercuum f. sp. fusiforme G11]
MVFDTEDDIGSSALDPNHALNSPIKNRALPSSSQTQIAKERFIHSSLLFTDPKINPSDPVVVILVPRKRCRQDSYRKCKISSYLDHIIIPRLSSTTITLLILRINPFCIIIFFFLRVGTDPDVIGSNPDRESFQASGQSLCKRMIGSREELDLLDIVDVGLVYYNQESELS